MHGEGVLKTKEGKDYAGRFHEGQLLHGEVKSPEGVYLGEFAPDTRIYHGRGVMKFTSGDVYDGKWANGLMHGHGRLVYSKIFADESEEEEEKTEEITSFYIGDFEENRRTEGTLTYENGDVFTGIFCANGLRESGCIKFKNGDEFAGIFEDGAMKCGNMTFKESGDIYSGEF